MFYTNDIRNLAISKILNGFLVKNQFNFDILGKHITFKDGYMVGGITKSTIVEMTDTIETIVKAISSKIDELIIIKNHAKKPDNIVIGFWKEGNTIYIDISQNINDRDKAIISGKERGEKAIYDIINDTSIYL
jgi:hypothetical protein